MRSANRRDTCVESITPQESDMSYCERTPGECRRGEVGGQTSHFQTLFRISFGVIEILQEIKRTIDICAWRNGRKAFQRLRKIGIGTIRVSILLSVLPSEARCSWQLGSWEEYLAQNTVEPLQGPL
jgi:hypothetical protein